MFPPLNGGGKNRTFCLDGRIPVAASARGVEIAENARNMEQTAKVVTYESFPKSGQVAYFSME
ncbi:MAG: hypothetical protein ACLGSH_06810, partial [Acidobacteriota bacterium]